MHELAIAEGIADVAEAKAHELHAIRVKRVRLRIGEASGVVSDSLTFCFEMVATERPLLAGALLAIDTTQHRAWCRDCAAEFVVRSYVARCPQCGEWSDQVISGLELQFVEMEIETSNEAPIAQLAHDATPE